MKKVSLAAAVLLFLLSSCGESVSTEDTVYVFRDSDNVPIKINMLNGNETAVCTDPVCAHTEDCPFAGVYLTGTYGDTYIAVGNTLCYTSGQALMTYDLLSGEEKILCEYEGIMLAGEAYPWLYFSVIEHTEDADGVRNTYRMKRADIRNGEITDMELGEYSTEGNSTDTSDIPHLYSADGDVLYWYTITEDGPTAFTTDTEGKNRRTYDISDCLYVLNGEYHDGWAYYKDYSGREDHRDITDPYERERWNEGVLCRRRLESGETEVLAEGIGEFTVLGDTVYFTRYTDEPQIIMNDEMTYYDCFDGDIWAMSVDGENERLVCDTDKNISAYTGKLFEGCVSVGGRDHLAVAYMDHCQGENGDGYGLAEKVIIIDVQAGEWKLSGKEGAG